MKFSPALIRRLAALFFSFIVFAGLSAPAAADPSKYPQFAQHAMPGGVEPAFIHLDEFVAEIEAGKKPVIIDVRTREEYELGHILGSVSVPLGEINLYLPSIPRDRPLVLY